MGNLKPSFSPQFWGIAAVAVVLGVAFMLLTHKGSTQVQREAPLVGDAQAVSSLEKVITEVSAVHAQSGSQTPYTGEDVVDAAKALPQLSLLAVAPTALRYQKNVFGITFSTPDNRQILYITQSVSGRDFCFSPQGTKSWQSPSKAISEGCPSGKLVAVNLP
jgi:hypothetical protein